MGSRENRAWLVRRGIYAAGFAAGLIVVAIGRGTVAEVEGWAPLIEQVATLAAALASGFAAVKTGPDSDDRRPVVPAGELADLADALIKPGPPGPPGPVGPMGESARVHMDELADGVAERLQDMADRAGIGGRDPLAELRAMIGRGKK